MKTFFLSLVVYVGFLGVLQAQIWEEGHYYDKRGNKHTGWVKHYYRADWGSGADNFIHFKDSLKSEKKKLTIRDVSSFVVEGDSFAIVNHFEINSMTSYSEDFAKVIVLEK